MGAKGKNAGKAAKADAASLKVKQAAVKKETKKKVRLRPGAAPIRAPAGRPPRAHSRPTAPVPPGPAEARVQQ